MNYEGLEMMNSIVIYGSHYGTTQQYAEELAKRINLKGFVLK